MLFAVTFAAAQSCQQAQIRITKQAVAIARPAAGFTPDRTQVRIVRQGLNGKPVLGGLASSPADEPDGSRPCAWTRTRAPSPP